LAGQAEYEKRVESGEARNGRLLLNLVGAPVVYVFATRGNSADALLISAGPAEGPAPGFYPGS
jgi:hypothetical protein